jgi:dienelactone hydrolase
MDDNKRLLIRNESGQALAAMLHQPEGRRNTAAVIIAHGMLSSKESAKHQELCTRAAAAGIMALRFDFRGRGESQGDPELLTISNEINDLRAVIATLQELGAVDLGVVGSSLGGTVALLTAAQHADLKALVSIASPAHLPTEPRPEWQVDADPSNGQRVRLGPGTYLSTRLFDDARRHDPIHAAHDIRCPWLIIHGRNDEVVPVAEAGHLATANTGAELAIHPSADHRFSTDDTRKWLIDRVIRFLTRHL